VARPLKKEQNKYVSRKPKEVLLEMQLMLNVGSNSKQKSKNFMKELYHNIFGRKERF